MNHEQINQFIEELRVRLINNRHVVVESVHFDKNPELAHDKIEIELYKDKPTKIPQITTVWEDGQTMSTAWNDIPARRLNSIEAVYRYCPIKLSTIKPWQLFQEVVKVFELNHVSTIEEA